MWLNAEIFYVKPGDEYSKHRERLITPAVNHRSNTSVLKLACFPNVVGYCQENFKCGTVTKRALKGKSEKWKARE